jgi:hypothetical protein
MAHSEDCCMDPLIYITAMDPHPPSPQKKKIKIGAFHLERRESKPKAQVRMNKDFEMNPKADDSHPSTNEA